MAIIVSRSSVTSRSYACGELWRIRPAAGIRGLTDAYDILRHGPDVVVIEPASLVEEVKKQLSETLRRYSQE